MENIYKLISQTPYQNILPRNKIKNRPYKKVLPKNQT